MLDWLDLLSFLLYTVPSEQKIYKKFAKKTTKTLLKSHLAKLTFLLAHQPAMSIYGPMSLFFMQWNYG